MVLPYIKQAFIQSGANLQEFKPAGASSYYFFRWLLTLTIQMFDTNIY